MKGGYSRGGRKMSEDFDVSIREAIPKDAGKLLEALRKIGSETDFLLLYEEEMALDVSELAFQLDALYQSENNLLLLAETGENIIGIASIKGDSHELTRHIGEVGICILKDYWDLGLGTLMMEELIERASASDVLFRLELTVQHRNLRAIHLYKKMGFQTECVMERGFRTAEGEFLEVDLMSLMIG